MHADTVHGLRNNCPEGMCHISQSRSRCFEIQHVGFGQDTKHLEIDHICFYQQRPMELHVP